MSRENDNQYGVIYTRSAIGFDEIPFDLILAETHGVENKITQYPVENGADINDHIIEEPESVSLRGFITGAPIKNFINDISEIGDGSGYSDEFRTRLPDALQKLLELAKGKKQANGTVKRQPVRLYTTLRIYDNMVIESIKIPKTDSVEALVFDMVLRKLNIVNSETVTGATVSSAGNSAAAGVEDQGVDELNKGKKPSNKTTAAELWDKGVDVVNDLFKGKK